MSAVAQLQVSTAEVKSSQSQAPFLTTSTCVEALRASYGKHLIHRKASHGDLLSAGVKAVKSFPDVHNKLNLTSSFLFRS